MTLRARLSAAIVLVAVLPILVVAVAVGTTVPASAERHARELLGARVGAAATALEQACGRAQVLAQLGLQRLRAGAPEPAVRAELRRQPGVARVDLPAPAAPTVGCAIGTAGISAAAVGKPCPAAARGCTSGPLAVTVAAAAADVEVRDAGGRIVAGAASPRGHRLHAERALPALGAVVDASTAAPDPLPLRAGLAGLVLVVALGAVVLGRAYASAAAAPLVAVADAAGRLAAGDLATRVPLRGRGEPARLAEAFNAMAGDLEGTVADLRRSQERLRRDLDRIGGALAATHDLDALLGVVLDTALDSAGAGAGAVFVVEPDGLRLLAGRGLEQRLAGPGRVERGSGVVGGVAAAGVGVVSSATVRAGTHPALDPAEPRAHDVLAVPLRRDGEVTAVLALYDRLDGRPFDDADLHAVGTLADQAGIAVANVELHREAERLSVTDPLTGLSNRRALMRQLAREVDRAERFGRQLALLLLDVDRFKRVNDTHGHAAGDAVLVAVARLLRDAVRDVDTVARYGGEELVAVLPETDVEGAARLAERICGRMRSTPVVVGEHRIQVTVSIGVAGYPDHGESASLLLRAADAAMYEAKQSGRDTWRVARPELPAG